MAGVVLATQQLGRDLTQRLEAVPDLSLGVVTEAISSVTIVAIVHLNGQTTRVLPVAFPSTRIPPRQGAGGSGRVKDGPFSKGLTFPHLKKEQSG
ncbi:hypothetical protein PC116_g18437 [Phytophthora cactorum]|uniref:Uncharacterized protein n=1 Tax=Phytophthora cactorum TaxID=29920 RepID=A0A8T1FFL6_9STRA|nr:hypothetical protein PC112_g14340 [Phytophthora cactorum]KAG2824617.1 hypothetical protein PC111_g9742 [Phytophthora cactorum]KAG2974640.1 hypothetical protein PC118_g14404 [Phytophthora cactorum]KAG3009698.1 hypothetical protein PC120_g15487 [Phytophthora cactorum]KAG4233345.1 hypothetical protein PC116_g18437 [Phytophthora cactorum]